MQVAQKYTPIVYKLKGDWLIELLIDWLIYWLNQGVMYLREFFYYSQALLIANMSIQRACLYGEDLFLTGGLRSIPIHPRR